MGRVGWVRVVARNRAMLGDNLDCDVSGQRSTEQRECVLAGHRFQRPPISLSAVPSVKLVSLQAKQTSIVSDEFACQSRLECIHAGERIIDRLSAPQSRERLES